MRRERRFQDQKSLLRSRMRFSNHFNVNVELELEFDIVYEVIIVLSGDIRFLPAANTRDEQSTLKGKTSKKKILIQLSIC